MIVHYENHPQPSGIHTCKCVIDNGSLYTKTNTKWKTQLNSIQLKLLLSCAFRCVLGFTSMLFAVTGIFILCKTNYAVKLRR